MLQNHMFDAMAHSHGAFLGRMYADGDLDNSHTMVVWLAFGRLVKGMYRNHGDVPMYDISGDDYRAVLNQFLDGYEQEYNTFHCDVKAYGWTSDGLRPEPGTLAGRRV